MNTNNFVPSSPVTRQDAAADNHPEEDRLELFALFPAELEAAETGAIAAHLDLCALCRVQVKALQALEHEAATFLVSSEGKAGSQRLRARFLESQGPAATIPGVVANPVPSSEEVVSEAPACEAAGSTPFSAEQQTVAEPARATLARPRRKSLLDLFFPDGMLRGMIKQRLDEQTLAKVALGGVSLDFLSDRPSRRCFIESGSTPALAFQGIIQHWLAKGEAPPSLAPDSNNFLLNQGIWATAGISSRLLYGNRYYNPKYAGCFPVSEEILDRAFAGDRQAKYRVAKAWENLIAKVKRYDTLFMTASKFHFFTGSFVGSKDNALLKAAFFSGCRSRLVLILDGSKLLLSDTLWTELDSWCILAIDQELHPNSDRAFKALFARQPIPERLLAIRFAVAQRNPCVKLKLRQSYVRYKNHEGRFRCEEVDTAGSWVSCVERLLKQKKELWICISEPDRCPAAGTFAAYMERAMDEGNACFERSGSKVRIGTPERVLVSVDPRTFSLDPHGPEAVTVWKCPMILLDGQAGPASAEQNSLQDAN